MQSDIWLKFENKELPGNDVGFSIKEWASKGHTELSLKELAIENEWFGFTLTDTVRFKQLKNPDSFSKEMLVPCSDCTTWVYQTTKKRRQLQGNLNYLGGTLQVSKYPDQLPLTSFQIGEKPCMNP